MPDYIYLLTNRLSPSQQSALQSIREIAREAGMTVFLTGGAVRDLTSGSPVRDIDVSVQGNALELKPGLEGAGAVLWGEHVPSQTVFARFPGSVRVEVSSTRREEFPQPGKPVYYPGSILEDLRRRDFTANAMALSLNEGSYGLLMDPLNGVADLEARSLRLVSNYGFLEDPIRMIRAARLQARLGWELEEKTKVRLDNAKEEGVTDLISPYQLGYEVEEIVHEEDGLKILKALEADGWMKTLYPAWTSAKVDLDALEGLRDVLVQLQIQGVNPDPSAAQAQLLTAKLSAKDVAALKTTFARQGFVKEWETQDERAKEVAKRLTGKEAALPSAAWKLLTSVDPEAVLWLGLTSKSAPVREKFNDFFNVWPEARPRIPYALMQEMRITPELEGYQELVKNIFFELIDGKLNTDEEMRAFLEPYSPPAPPPPVTIRRTRAKRGAGKSVEAREVDDDDLADNRPDGDDEPAEDLDEDSDAGDERGELIARSAPYIPPPPPPPPPAVEEETSVEPDIPPVPPAPRPLVQAAPSIKLSPEPVAADAPKPRTTQPAPTKAPTKVSTPVAVKSVVKSAAKTATTEPAPKPNAAKVVPAKSAKANIVAAPRAKTAVKSAAKSKPPLKKAAAKPIASHKPSKPQPKAKPAKAVVKAKAIPVKAKPAVKSKASAKPPAKPSRKAIPVKKKR